MPTSSRDKAKQTIQSVLGYFVNMQRLAQISNDRRAVMHFEECWAEVWRAYCGGYSLPVYQATHATPSYTAPVPASKPPWMIAKYARPMRKVVGRIEERVRLSRNTPAVRVSYDILECGHRVEGNENYGAAAPARHRRCVECVHAIRAEEGKQHECGEGNTEASQVENGIRGLATRNQAEGRSRV